MAEFDRELANESIGHLYSRECCANTWYAIGAWHMRHARMADAVAAFDLALQRVPKHALAQLGRAAAAGTTPPAAGTSAAEQLDGRGRLHGGRSRSRRVARRGRAGGGRGVVGGPVSNAAWLLPVEPLLNVGAAPGEWKSAAGAAPRPRRVKGNLLPFSGLPARELRHP